jgi:hypothetical protein
MNQTIKTRRSWYHLRWWQAILLLIVVCGGWYFFRMWQGERELQAVMAEWDAIGLWRQEEIKARLLANGEGSGLAKYVKDLGRELPGHLSYEDDAKHFITQPYFPQHLLHPDTVAFLEKRYSHLPQIQHQLNNLLTFPVVPLQGTVRHGAAEYVFSSHESNVLRQLLSACHHNKLLHLQAKQFDAAINLVEAESKLAALCLAEPITFDQIIGHNLVANWLSRIDKLLANGEYTEAQLARMDHLLRQFDCQQLWKKYLQTAPGSTLAWIKYLAHSNDDISKLVSMPTDDSFWVQWKAKLDLLMLRSECRSTNFQAEMLQHELDIYRRADLPLLAQHQQLSKDHEQHRKRHENKLTAHRFVIQPHHYILKTCILVLAKQRCTQLGLAAERYRLQHHRWPTSQEELIPKYLDQALLDPFDDKPLRFKVKSDGLVIYSIGVSLGNNIFVDNDGDVIGTVEQPPRDTGIKLWNPEQRRLPAKPLYRPPPEFSTIEW